MNLPVSYQEFLEAKMVFAPVAGFVVADEDINPLLKPHQKAMVKWAIMGGRRALFAAFGLGKTFAQIEILRIICEIAGGRTLQVAPLGVRLEFFNDVRTLATGDHPDITDAQRGELAAWLKGHPERVPSLTFIRSIDDAGPTGNYITNYETVRDGKLDPKDFTAASLDEASCLRGFGGTKTFREFMRLFDGMRFKFVATATPSPNQYIELLAYSAFLEVMDVGQAKAQPLDAKILTPTGWRLMGELQVGDMVIAGDGSPTRILGVYPQGERPIYRVGFSDGASTECDGDHLWLTQTTYQRNNERRYPKGSAGTVRTTSEIAATLYAPTRAEKNHTIPIVNEVQFESREVAIDPWLLGFMLGDGCLRNTSIVVSTVDDWIVKAVTLALPEGLRLRRTTDDGCDYSITTTGVKGGRGPGSNPILSALRGYGILGKRAWEKSIPRDYLFNLPEVRLAILRGLMDADGTVDHSNGPTLTTTSEDLARDVQTLVRSLGGIATYRRASSPGRDAYRVVVTMPADVNPFSLPRKAAKARPKTKYPARRYIISIEPAGAKPAQCIAVEHPDRLYVTDDFVVTHNTRFFKRNSEKADTLTIHPHKEEEFWLWVASWGLFVQKPSDLGFSDDGYELPGIDIIWHEIPADHSTAGVEKSGQGRLLRNAAASLSDAAQEKRDSLEARIAKMMELRALDPEAHRVIWHDLEAEREAIERAVSGIATVYGSQDMEEREQALGDFAYGRIPELATKPIIAGSGSNFQRYCWWEIFLGIGFKFNDLIQAVHRTYRFLQRHRVRIDLIYTEAERPIRDSIEAKWRRHDEQMAVMTAIIRKYGLSEAAMADGLKRGMGVPRVEVKGETFTLVNADCVEETRRMADNSVQLVITSIPFSTQYEYSPNYADFGHTDDDGHFWRQMDFLIPELLRVLEPGRVAAIHVKDRIVPGGLTGLGFQTVAPFSDDCIAAFRRHGFAFLSRKTITTDVVRENNQTYRLGWTEQCKDGSRMGNGLPEYLLIFRKPPSDSSNGYADQPVHKDKREWKDGVWTNDGYSRARWQLDAHGFAKSDGNRLLAPDEIMALDSNVIFKVWRRTDLSNVYSYRNHVELCEALEERGALPPTFMLLPPHSSHPDVWTDVTRMRTLNGAQYAAGREMHLCPLQFDVVDRAIVQYSQPGETVFDPFAGLCTVPFRALKLKRRGYGIELNPAYFADGRAYVEAAALEMATPSLFDLMGVEADDQEAA